MCWCVCKSARILDRGCMNVKALWTPSFTIIRYSTEKSGALHITHHLIYMCTQFITKLFHNN